MIRRAAWFLSGLAAGVAAAIVVGRRLKRRLAEFAPVRLAERTMELSRDGVTRARVAISEGRSALRNRERKWRDKVFGSSIPSPATFGQSRESTGRPSAPVT